MFIISCIHAPSTTGHTYSTKVKCYYCYRSCVVYVYARVRIYVCVRVCIHMYMYIYISRG